jgi:hypothetical protein
MRKNGRMKELIYLLLSICFLGCNNNKLNTAFDQSIDRIKVNVSNAESIKLSKLYSKVDLVKLQTNDKALLGEIKKFIVDEKRFYFISNSALVAFDREGLFKFKIDNLGNGPGEFLVISDVHIDKETGQIEIYDSKSTKIITYNNQGDFIEEWHTGLNGYSFANLGNSNYAIYIGSSFYNSESNYRLNIISKSKDDIDNKFIKIKENETKFLHFGDLTNFSYFNDTISFLYSFNDTIYTVNRSSLFPRLVVDFGNKKLPSSFLEASYTDVRDFLETLKKTDYAFRTIGWFESKNHIVFSFMHQQDILHVYYDKGSGNKIIANKLIDDLIFNGFEEPSSFENLPKANLGEKFYTLKTAYGFIEIVNSLKDRMTPGEWNDFKSENPNLVSIYKNSKIDDNPIVMVGEMKNF